MGMLPEHGQITRWGTIMSPIVVLSSTVILIEFDAIVL